MAPKSRTSISVDEDILKEFYKAALNGYVNQGKFPKGALSEHFEQAMILWLATPSDERQKVIEEWRNGEHAKTTG